MVNSARPRRPFRKLPAVSAALFAAFTAATTMAALVLGGGPAKASPIYPEQIQLHLGEGTPLPSCTICHETTLGGSGTVTRPHGEAMIAAGLFADDVDSLFLALDALEAAGVDSDQGGVPDIDELRHGSDPNIPSDDRGPGPGPLQYGFGCTQAGSTPPLVGGALVWLLLALRRRRR